MCRLSLPPSLGLKPLLAACIMCHISPNHGVGTSQQENFELQILDEDVYKSGVGVETL